MKKNFRWISIQLICFSLLFPFNINKSYSQQLWGMTSDGGGKKNGGNIFSISADGSGFTERFSFFDDGSARSGQQLLDYGDGFLYGVSSEIIYKFLPNGSSYEALYKFQEATGNYPCTRLMKGEDGYLYGASYDGGNYGDGVLYKVKKDGTNHQVLHHFNLSNFGIPNNLIQLNNGRIYGTTETGGASEKGMLYSIEPDGTNFQVLHSFNGINGNSPNGGLVVLTVNATTFLYGVTGGGGTNDNGVIYRIKPDGTNFSRQFNFSENSGCHPKGSLIKIENILYGVTTGCGNNGGGVVFAYNAESDSYQKLHQFTYTGNDADECFPPEPLLYQNNKLYGTAFRGGQFGPSVLFCLNLDGSGYQVIHEFVDESTDPGTLSTFNNKIYGLTEGILYGKDGIIYRLNPDGTGFQTIHSFAETNGHGPTGSLIRAQDGNLYGLTPYGGSKFSNGIAFSIRTDGTNFTPLQWLGNGGAAGVPKGSLVQASNGSFYGMNFTGGAAFAGQVFRLRLTLGIALDFETYDIFCQAPDCSMHPVASLVQASDGNLYGMTPHPGNLPGEGNIFRVSTNGTNYTLLKKFNGTNGANPAGSLIQAPDGYLYGMTENGGSNDFGVIFRIRTDGTGFQTIFQFGESPTGLFGTHPKGSLLLGSDGKLYGMAREGGNWGAGTVFEIDTHGTSFTVLHNFNRTSGAFPVSSLIEHVSSGYLFGMTELGGTSNFGTIFKIKKDGTSFQKLLDFNGTNGKYPKGDLLIVPTIPLPQKNPLSPIAEKNLEKNSLLINISPNPVRNTVTIHFQKQLSGKVTCTLNDVQGRKVLQETIDARLNTTIDLSQVPRGTYVLELQVLGEKVSKKIVKQ